MACHLRTFMSDWQILTAGYVIRYTDVKHVLIHPYSFLSFPRPQSEEWEVAAPWRQSQSRQSAHEPHRPPHRAAETRDSRMLSNIKTLLDGRRQEFWCWFFCWYFSPNVASIEVATQRKHLCFGRCHFPVWSVSILETMWIHGLNFEHLKCRIPSRLNRATTLTLFRILKIQTSLHVYAHFIQSLTCQCYFQLSLRIKQFPTAHNCTTFCFTCNANFHFDNFTTKAMHPPRRQSQSLSPWIYTWHFCGSKSAKPNLCPRMDRTYRSNDTLVLTHSQSFLRMASFKWMSLGHGPDRPSPNRSAGNLHL